MSKPFVQSIFDALPEAEAPLAAAGGALAEIEAIVGRSRPSVIV